MDLGKYEIKGVTLRRKLIYLIAYPGVGKLTIANEICKIEDYILQDNHKTMNLLFPFVDMSKKIPEVAWENIISIRYIIYNFIKRNYNKDSSLIFTDCLRNDDERANQVFNEIKDIATTLDLEFVPIFLDCDMDEIRKRICSEDRKKRYKLTRVEDAFFEWKNLIIVEELNQIHIDVTALSAIAAAKTILKEINKKMRLKD